MAVTSAGPYANNLHLAPEIHYIYNTKHYSVTRWRDSSDEMFYKRPFACPSDSGPAELVNPMAILLVFIPIPFRSMVNDAYLPRVASHQ